MCGHRQRHLPPYAGPPVGVVQCPHPWGTPMSVAALRRAVRESVSGLPREFWWLWTSTLVNRLGAFVATFMALYLTLDRGYSASCAGLPASPRGLGGVISSLGGGVMADRLGRRPTLLVAQASTAVSVALLGFV